MELTTLPVKAPTSSEYQVAKQIATAVAHSGYYKLDGTTYEHRTAQALVKILRGRDLGIPPMTAIQDIHIIEGKTSVGAHLMAALIRQSSEYDYKILKGDDKKAEIEFFRLWNGEWESMGTSIYTWEMAVKSGKSQGANYENWKEDMLYARALSRGTKRFCPDLLMGSAYVTGELEEEPQEDHRVHVMKPLHIDEATGVIDEATGVIVEGPENPPSTSAPDSTPQEATQEAALAEDAAQEDPSHQESSQETSGDYSHDPKAINKLGAMIYGDEWDAKRDELVHAVSNGKAKTWEELEHLQQLKIVAGLERLADGQNA